MPMRMVLLSKLAGILVLGDQVFIGGVKRMPSMVKMASSTNLPFPSSTTIERRLR